MTDEKNILDITINTSNPNLSTSNFSNDNTNHINNK